MNVNDVNDDAIPETREWLRAIFVRQHQLMEKYHPIEFSNGLLQTPDIPVRIDDHRGQARLKDLAWRTVEEIGESMEAFYGETDPLHAMEEIADALHFLVELSISADMDWNDVVILGPMDLPRIDEPLAYAFYRAAQQHGFPSELSPNYATGLFVVELSKAMNCLKNKPWKQTQMPTDVIKFRDCLIDAWTAFFAVAHTIGISAITLFNLYFKKSEVNKFRQRSNY